jgi:hypothetical protein
MPATDFLLFYWSTVLLLPSLAASAPLKSFHGSTVLPFNYLRQHATPLFKFPKHIAHCIARSWLNTEH